VHLSVDTGAFAMCSSILKTGNRYWGELRKVRSGTPAIPRWSGFSPS
jgi:hypothetical protein